MASNSEEIFLRILTDIIAKLCARRAHVNIKLNNFNQAVADANMSLQFNPTLWKAFLYKGIACMKLEEYATARTALELGDIWCPENPRFTELIKECDERIQDKNAWPQNDLKYRHECYQKTDEIVIIIFAKDVPQYRITAVFYDTSVDVMIYDPDEDHFTFRRHLFGKVITDKCWYEAKPTKIEIHLPKAEPIHWASLEQKGLEMATVAATTKLLDWDELEAKVKEEEEEEKLDRDDEETRRHKSS